MMGRMMLPIIMAVVALMVASWALGEFLRQRKDK
jgi:hypothetical protein